MPIFSYDPLADPAGFKLMPYTVLDTTAAWWRARRAQWVALGIRPEVRGRGSELLISNQRGLLSYEVECDSCGRRPPKVAAITRQEDNAALRFDMQVAQVATTYPQAGQACVYGATYSCPGTYKPIDRSTTQGGAQSAIASGTSIFDPVLTEALYRWYGPHNGIVLDPFAGGAVRGVVAYKLGRQYLGIELRPEQVADNVAQAGEIAPHAGLRLRWLQGDCTQVLAPVPAPYAPGSAHHTLYDFIIGCPPYYDAEVYSDDPRDLSNLPTYEDFKASYYAAIGCAARLLAPDRFCAWVVGEARGKDGNEYGIVADTVRGFALAGLALHSSAVLVNALGTLPLRINRQWGAARRMGRHHQHVLVFVKGDPRRAVQAQDPLVLPLEQATTTEEAQ